MGAEALNRRAAKMQSERSVAARLRLGSRPVLSRLRRGALLAARRLRASYLSTRPVDSAAQPAAPLSASRPSAAASASSTAVAIPAALPQT